ncbi:30S ribosomal protein S14 [Thalassoroseus pseudoceratinae]|uniref:30S ribosomal protein S14 n=1 Tax=Thalassoroseus pseudoceratinae TaxID=2713176 RepID=UPI00141DEA65|nr:30S ribosomal protein S14 [Thalassoroseus pseudoceratinae]
MASKAKIEKQKRNARLVQKYAEKRKQLKEEGDWAALDALPRNSSPTRLRRLCALTGRPRGVYRKFQISRIMLRDMALDGLIPGMKKASW